MSAGRRRRWVGYRRRFLGIIVATALSRAYNHPLESWPRPQAAFIWERSVHRVGRLQLPAERVLGCSVTLHDDFSRRLWRDAPFPALL
jgi:hypothetical protein